MAVGRIAAVLLTLGKSPNPAVATGPPPSAPATKPDPVAPPTKGEEVIPPSTTRLTPPTPRPESVPPPTRIEVAAVPAPPPTKPKPPPPVRTGGDVKEFEVAPGVRMRFCWVPAGTATLGSPAAEKERYEDEKERRFATKGFWLGKYEVTQGEWKDVTGRANPSEFDGTKDNKAKGLTTDRFPVETVSWNDAAEFCNRVSERAGKSPRYKKVADDKWEVVESADGFRLPHEDEWEYACHGGLGNGRPYYFGDSLNGDKANCNGDYPYGTTTKGNYKGRPSVAGE